MLGVPIAIVAELLMNTVQWEPCDPPLLRPVNGTPYITHLGTLRIGSHILDVVKMSDGQSLITRESLARFLCAG